MKVKFGKCEKCQQTDVHLKGLELVGVDAEDFVPKSDEDVVRYICAECCRGQK